MTIKRMATLADVAKLAGVGTTTVSRVINGGKRVSTETFTTVSRAIEELRFVPNLAARVLKGDRSKLIGLVVPTVADPFFAQCAEVIQSIARRYGCLVTVCSTANEPARELENIDLLSRRVDGILIAPSESSSKALNHRLSNLDIPVVYFDKPLRGTSIPGVSTRNYDASKMITNHLLEHGYDRILCIGGESRSYTIRERIRGYSAAMTAANKPLLIDTSPLARSDDEKKEVLIRHLSGSHPPQAIYCLKSTTTMHTFDTLVKLGIKIPQQVALAGHDDFLLSTSLRPSVTVIRQPIEQVAQAAAELLFEALSLLTEKLTTDAPQPQQHITIASDLLIRASCGCLEMKPTESIASFHSDHLALPSPKSPRKTRTKTNL